MSRTTTLNVRVSGVLGDFVPANVGDDGAYASVSEYVRDLIRRDMARAEGEMVQRLKAELQHAFATPDDSYQPLDAETVIERGRPRPAS
ncbi:MAG: addiction module antitoxin [Pseudomonadota bacterium]